MSITDDLQLAQANEQLLRLYRSLAILKADLGESNPTAFKILSEGPLNEIKSIRETISEYTDE